MTAPDNQGEGEFITDLNAMHRFINALADDVLGTCARRFRTHNPNHANPHQQYDNCIGWQPLPSPSTDIPPPSSEQRVTSPTGGQKGKKRAQLGALDPTALMSVAEVAGFGAEKYARYNFLKGYAYSLTYDACQRHLHAFWAGEDNDPESGLPHLAHACWHTLAMLAFLQRGVGDDDRPDSVYDNDMDTTVPTVQTAAEQRYPPGHWEALYDRATRARW